MYVSEVMTRSVVTAKPTHWHDGSSSTEPKPFGLPRIR